MVLIFLTNGDCIEVEAAIRARVQEDELHCLDRKGQVVATFPAMDVQTYTADPALKEAIEDEVCDEVTTIPASDEPKQPALDT